MIKLLSSALVAFLLVAAAPAAHAFGFADVDRRAREVANRPYAKSSFILPKPLKDLGYDQTRDIRFDPARSLWRAQKLPFEVQFFHLGGIFDQPVRIYEVVGNEVSEIVGLLARKAKLFMTPDETQPPREVVATAHYAANARPSPRFADAVIDPEVYAVVRSAAHCSRSALAAAQRMQRVECALQAGPHFLSRDERVALLHDGAALDQMQRAARAAPIHSSWYAGSISARRATIKVFARPRDVRNATVATMARAR